MQRAGGSVAHPAEVMDEELEQRAAYIEGGAGLEASTMGRLAGFAGIEAERLQRSGRKMRLRDEASYRLAILRAEALARALTGFW